MSERPTAEEAAEMNRRIRDKLGRGPEPEPNADVRSRSQEIAEARRLATRRIVDRLARRGPGE